MTELSFSVVSCTLPTERNGHQLRILVNGVDLIERVDRSAAGYDPEMAMLGMDPIAFFKQTTLEAGGGLIIARCNCGDEGCSSIAVVVHTSLTEVSWSLRPDGTEVVRFGRDQYISAIGKARNDHSWETLERTAERLIAELEWARLAPLGITLCHVYARGSKDSLSVTFWLESQGRYQLVCSLAWNHLRPNAAVDAARRQLLEIEPARWSEVVYYPQAHPLPRPALAGPGWRPFDPGPR